MSLDTTKVEVPRAPTFYDIAKSPREASSEDGAHGCYLRGQNFCIGYSELDAGQAITESAVQDEHIVLVPDAGGVLVRTGDGQSASVMGPAVIIIPAGTATIEAIVAGALLRVFTARADVVLRRARNAASYGEADPMVDLLPARPTFASPGTLRVHQLDAISHEPGRLGRIFQSDSLMINWFPALDGPRDPSALSPHVHQGFEQASVTLAGRHVHHVRLPWSPRLADWRDDEHVECASPSVTIIPPGNIHTTQAVGRELHHLVDVFAPPRQDFLRNGWVLNQADYAADRTTP